MLEGTVREESKCYDDQGLREYVSNSAEAFGEALCPVQAVAEAAVQQYPARVMAFSLGLSRLDEPKTLKTRLPAPVGQ